MLEMSLHGEPVPQITGTREWSCLTWFLGMDPEDALMEDALKVPYPAEMGFVGVSLHC